jgi:anti-anti-sigma factor
MSEPGSPIEACQRDGAQVITFRDRILLDHVVIDRIERHLMGILRGHPGDRVIIDFTGVQALSSRMLSLLVNARGESAENGGTIELCNLSPTARKAFDVTRMADLFRVFEDRVSTPEDAGG